MENYKHFIIVIAMIFIIRLVFALFSNHKVKKVGKAGEKKLFKILKSCKTGNDYAAGNLYIPVANDNITELDGLFINERGIFVFEAKNYTGTIYGNDLSHDWSKTMFTKNGTEKKTFYNPIMQNSGHVRAVKNAIDLSNTPVFNVVAFADSADITKVETNSPYTYVVNYREIPSLLRNTGTSAISRKEIKRLKDEFKKFKKVKKSTLRKHIKDVKSKES